MINGRLRPTDEAPAKAAALADVIGARVHVQVQVPRTQVSGQMRLVDRAESFAILVETRKLFDDRDLPTDAGALAAPGVMNEWNCEIATRHLAIAVRDPADASKPLAELEEWRQCDDDQISALWQEYQDLRERMDPLAKFEELSQQDLDAIASAAKKKSTDLLLSYGSRKLAAYVITSAVPPAS